MRRLPLVTRGMTKYQGQVTSFCRGERFRFHGVRGRERLAERGKIEIGKREIQQQCVEPITRNRVCRRRCGRCGYCPVLCTSQKSNQFLAPLGVALEHEETERLHVWNIGLALGYWPAMPLACDIKNGRDIKSGTAV
jgi:hypothetical protein